MNSNQVKMEDPVINTDALNQNNNIINPNKRETPEIIINCIDGCCFFVINLLMFFGSIALIVLCCILPKTNAVTAITVPIFVICLIASIICFCGYFINDPNEAHVITFFGTYRGTVKKSGFFWTNPFTSKKSISLRSNNLNGEVIKVNDKVGNPIMVGCVVVWRVNDTAKACFDVQDYYNYVRVQSESAVRYVGCMYPYDKVNENDVCLRSGHEEVHKVLQQELSERLSTAGIEVQEARITELAYSSEIANAMLKRQAAEAIIAAREKIVQGAVSIVGHALNSLNQNKICELTNEERSKLVSNMLVVLCSESQVSPVVNTGHS